MKNTTKFFLLLFIIIGSIFMVSDISAATLTQEKTSFKFMRKYPGHPYDSEDFKNYYIDGVVAYCIEPRVHEGTNDYLDGIWSDTGLPESIKDRVILIAYYGYTYPNHQTNKMRMATQAMIWETIMGPESWVKFSTDYWNKGTIINIDEERATIESLIASHTIKPSFNGQSYELKMGEYITLNDTNGVLDQYDITVSNAIFTQNGNELTITPTSDGTITIRMVKKMNYDSNYKIFFGDGIQNILAVGNSDPVLASTTITVKSLSKIELHKLDKENNTSAPQGQATLEGAVYGVYTLDGTLVTTLTTDANGYAISDEILTVGDYYVKEITHSNGYLIDESKTFFSTTTNNPIVSVTVYEEVVKNRISILKQYSYVNGNSSFLNAESNVKFEISYLNGDKYATITTDKNGYASIDLPYGKWLFHQVNTETGYEKIYDFYVTVDYNSESTHYYNILNNKISAYLQVIKYDEETGKNIALANTTFKIFNEDTNQYVSQYVAGVVHDEFSTDENGLFTTYLKLEAGNYKLYEIKAPNGYLISNEGLSFTIGSDSEYNYSNYGATIVVKFPNTSIKGIIEINKKGEDIVYDHNGFSYIEKPLEKVSFNIYADEDILSPDKKTIYYKKGTLIQTIITNKNGYAVTKQLPIGKYLVVEVKTDSEHSLDTNKYKVQISQIDDKTPLVYKVLNLKNYLKKGDFELTKIDLSTGEAIPNTTFEIYNINDELIFTGTTDKLGKILVKGLRLGKYYFIETNAPEKYILNQEKGYFEILNDGEIIKSKVSNKAKEGKLLLTKVDSSTGKRLPNAVFEIYDEETGKLICRKTTDANGNIELKLKYGKYSVLEIEAPEGFSRVPDKTFFEILEDEQIIELTMTNEQIITDVPSTEKNNSFLLKILPIVFAGIGVGLLLYAKNGKK